MWEREKDSERERERKGGVGANGKTVRRWKGGNRGRYTASGDRFLHGRQWNRERPLSLWIRCL